MASALRFAKSVFKYGIPTFGACYCTQRYLCSITLCEGASMEPVIQHGDIVLNSPLFVDYSWLKKGDVVFCRDHKEPGMLICKRLVGLEGDRVYNNERGFEEYVDKGHVWLEGDNQDISIDSRSYGPLPYGLLVSKGFLRVWPLHRVGVISFPEEPKNTH